MKFINLEENLESVLPEIPLPFTGSGSLNENYTKIQKIFETRGELSDYESLYSEICTCLTLGLNQASITLTNHLLEKSLLIALIYNYTLQNLDSKKDLEFNDLFETEIEKFNKYMLKEKIDACFRNKLITEIQKDFLHKYRDQIRNGFSHSNLKKIFGEASIDAKLVMFEKGELKSKDIKLELWKSIIPQGLTQAMLAKQIAFNYFISVDIIIRHIHKKIFQKK